MWILRGTTCEKCLVRKITIGGILQTRMGQNYAIPILVCKIPRDEKFWIKLLFTCLSYQNQLTLLFFSLDIV